MSEKVNRKWSQMARQLTAIQSTKKAGSMSWNYQILIWSQFFHLIVGIGLVNPVRPMWQTLSVYNWITPMFKVPFIFGNFKIQSMEYIVCPVRIHSNLNFNVVDLTYMVGLSKRILWKSATYSQTCSGFVFLIITSAL